MFLIDTSVWIDYFRQGGDKLAALLENNQVLMHPFIIGELACGHLRNRDGILALLHELPEVTVATDPEVLHFIAQRNLMARGVRYLDMHLLASIELHGQASLWTQDKRLAAVFTETSSRH